MKKISYILIVILAIVIGYMLGNNNNDKEILVNSTNKNNSDTLSMMYEREFGKGEYIVSSSLNWPDSQSYSFNPRLSKCENGGTLSWDSTTNQVIMTGDKSDKCYVYFDIAPYHVTCSDNTLACQIAKTYTTDGANNLYYHDGYGYYTNSNLEAGDYSYRYAGSNETTNNYVCFGSTESTCPAENLYRIIGVFKNDTNDGTYNVKLIKATYATENMLHNDFYDSMGSDYATGDEFYWNGVNKDNGYNSYGFYNIWKVSILNINYLNGYYLDEYLGEGWSNKIAMHTWVVGGNTTSNLSSSDALVVYSSEILNPSSEIESTYTSKVGLMYISDYMYSASPEYWSYGARSNDIGSYKDAISYNWNYINVYDMTITRFSNTKYVCYITSDGYAFFKSVDTAGKVRPTFYLNSNVTLSSGTGSSSDPYQIR